MLFHTLAAWPDAAAVELLVHAMVSSRAHTMGVSKLGHHAGWVLPFVRSPASCSCQLHRVMPREQGDVEPNQLCWITYATTGQPGMFCTKVNSSCTGMPCRVLLASFCEDCSPQSMHRGPTPVAQQHCKTCILPRAGVARSGLWSALQLMCPSWRHALANDGASCKRPCQSHPCQSYPATRYANVF